MSWMMSAQRDGSSGEAALRAGTFGAVVGAALVAVVATPAGALDRMNGSTRGPIFVRTAYSE